MCVEVSITILIVNHIFTRIKPSASLLIAVSLFRFALSRKKLDVFRNKLMARHPPVFGDWFLTTFPDPTSWYTARLAYARSTAVMSMVCIKARLPKADVSVTAAHSAKKLSIVQFE